MRRLLPLALLVIGGFRGASAQSSTRPVVIYLHGRIIEEQGPKAVSPDYGPYAYDAILDSLRASGFELIADQRPKGTDPVAYAGRVAAQVDSLLKAGVQPGRIAVVGFSKGGGIAIQAAAKIKRTDITYVFMGACSPEPATVKVAGRILSLFEQSDTLGRSCRTLFAAALPGTVHEERELRTGQRHGAFYRPTLEWLGPVRAWIGRKPLSPS